MATINTQRDRVATYKKETILNVGILSKVHGMSTELSREIFKDTALDKLTQNLFNHLSYYLVTIIDNKAANGLPWPLYDTKTEKAFRNGLSNFINDYSSKGLLAPVMSSYLVNPSSYKITVLVFQMSQLAVQKTLLSKMSSDDQKQLYHDTTEKYKSQDKEGFTENVEKTTASKSITFSNYMCKRNKLEQIAEIMRKRITEMESKISSLKPQEYINNLVDDYMKKHDLDDDYTKSEILNIKNVNKPAKFFDAWLSDVDEAISKLENQWDTKMSPFIKLAIDTQHSTEMLIARQTGEAERSSYMLEFNPKSDDICTKELQSQVNSEQKYILKNIVINNQLNFPNLIRGFLVAVSFIQRNAEHGDEIYKFNKYLDVGRENYSDMVTAMRVLIDRVRNVENKLQSRQVTYNQSISLKNFVEIPPLPDLSDLKMGKDSQIVFDSFTPLNVSKHQFNLRRRTKASFAKPQSRSLLITPFYQGTREDFLKSLISCHISSYDRPNTTQNLNMSVISQKHFRNNETIAECSSGFTKEQIKRLLSTKKSSSSKKLKYKTERPSNINIKKGGLFNETQHTPTDSNGLYRSYSSPNLYEHREKKSKLGRKLSIMQEDYPLLEVSGILSLENENSYGTPEGVEHLANSRKLFDAPTIPVIRVTPEPKRTKLSNEVQSNSTELHFADLNLLKLHDTVVDKEEIKTETPKTNTQLIKKTSSLEKIINRFKKVRANVLPYDKEEDDFKTIVEEKENLNAVNVDVFTANRILLPDLLSPSCSGISKKSMDLMDQMHFDSDDVVSRKPRESLGTALGVDHTFLDQFDLID